MRKIKPSANLARAIQVLLAGLTASLVMLGLSYLVGPIGISSPDYAAQYAAVFIPEEDFITNALWWMGMGIHLLLGTFAFSFLFDYLDNRHFAENLNWLPRAGVYGAALWLFNSAVIAPLAAEGFFFRYMFEPFTLTITNLICWWGYSVVLTSMTRKRVARQRITPAESEFDRKWAA